MKALFKALYALLRWFSYFMLFVVMAGFSAAYVLHWLNLCPKFDEGGIVCTSAFAETVGELSMTIMLVSVFTGFPLLFALLGIVFLVLAIVRARRRNASAGQG